MNIFGGIAKLLRRTIKAKESNIPTCFARSTINGKFIDNRENPGITSSLYYQSIVKSSDSGCFVWTGFHVYGGQENEPLLSFEEEEQILAETKLLREHFSFEACTPILLKTKDYSGGGKKRNLRQSATAKPQQEKHATAFRVSMIIINWIDDVKFV